MDLATVLALIVAALIAFSGYFLFNGLPTVGGSRPEADRRTRRS